MILGNFVFIYSFSSLEDTFFRLYKFILLHYSILGIDPTLDDTDEDGFTDYAEIVRGTDPLVADAFQSYGFYLGRYNTT